MSHKIMFTSPNQKHEARLSYEGEIRFGPPYFRLELNGKVLPGRLFGKEVCWSDDSKYLAAEEWLTTDYQIGPITRVLLIDVETNRYSEFKVIEKGFAEDFRFARDTFIYRKHFYGTGQVTEAEVDISRIINWKKIGL